MIAITGKPFCGPGGAASEVFDGPLVRRDELIFGGRRFIQPSERDQIAPVRYRDVLPPPRKSLVY